MNNNRKQGILDYLFQIICSQPIAEATRNLTLKLFLLDFRSGLKDG